MLERVKSISALRAPRAVKALSSLIILRENQVFHVGVTDDKKGNPVIIGRGLIL